MDSIITQLNKFKEFVKKAWNYKILRWALILQFSYLVVSSIITLIFFRNMNDFRVYYEVGEAFVSNITNLYQIEYQWPFRYFPISALFFVIFYFMGFDLGFISFNLINFLLNCLISLLIFKIISIIKAEDHQRGNQRVILYVSLFLMGTPQLFNYVLGQINLYITFSILLSLYLFLKYDSIKCEILASFILGASVIFKPITLFMFPFLIIIRYDKHVNKIKFQFVRSLFRITGALIPLSLNLIIFLSYPTLLNDFINTNLTGEETVLINHSISLTKIISNLLYMLGFRGEILLDIQFPLFLTIFILFFIISYVFYFFLQSRDFQRINLLYGYLLGILIMFISYFDTWNHHLIILLPLLIIMIFHSSRNSPTIEKYIKRSFLFMNFFDIIFLGLFFVVESFFPINFVGTIFLFIVFFGILFFCYKGELNYEANHNPE